MEHLMRDGTLEAIGARVQMQKISNILSAKRDYQKGMSIFGEIPVQQGYKARL